MNFYYVRKSLVIKISFIFAKLRRMFLKLLYPMKKKYEGLKIKVIYTEPVTLLQNSKVRLKAKTEVRDWHTDDIDIEMGMDDMTITDSPFTP